MTFIEAAKEMDEYLKIDETPYGHTILEVKLNNDDSYEFEIREGRFAPFHLRICENGKIIDEDGYDCLDAAISAYDYNSEYINFKAKWYKEE